jgi:8-oxo-dGTP pyrophosphatase MutT (NUDIX family)
MESVSCFLASRQPEAVERSDWGSIRLQVISYLCADLPPDELITSIRAVVCDSERVLVVRDPESEHILPGGRREPDETIEQTLRREVLEETGWQIDRLSLLGVKHFHHLTPEPAEYPYPYPDFFQLIYHAIPLQYHADARESEGYEIDSQLISIVSLDQEALTACERVFLEAAQARTEGQL